jgi:hypothetical protein
MLQTAPIEPAKRTIKIESGSSILILEDDIARRHFSCPATDCHTQCSRIRLNVQSRLLSDSSPMWFELITI